MFLCGTTTFIPPARTRGVNVAREQQKGISTLDSSALRLQRNKKLISKTGRNRPKSVTLGERKKTSRAFLFDRRFKRPAACMNAMKRIPYQIIY